MTVKQMEYLRLQIVKYSIIIAKPYIVKGIVAKYL